MDQINAVAKSSRVKIKPLKINGSKSITMYKTSAKNTSLLKKFLDTVKKCIKGSTKRIMTVKNIKLLSAGGNAGISL